MSRPAEETSSLLPTTPTTEDRVVVVEFGRAADNDDDNGPSAAPVLLRHDSEFSVGTAYHDGSPNDLTALQGAVLLTAECLGTGLLALPGDVHVLGFYRGLFFLLLNIPINLAAGTILSATASMVEERQKVEDRLFQAALNQEWDEAQQDYQQLNELTAESAFTVQTTQTQHTHLHHDTVRLIFST